MYQSGKTGTRINKASALGTVNITHFLLCIQLAILFAYSTIADLDSKFSASY